MGPARVPSLICDALERQAVDRPRAEAMRSDAENRSVSFAELRDRVSAWGRLLRGAGIVEGEMAGVATGNVLAFPELFFALRSIGAAALALDEGLGEEALAVVARRMKARWILRRDGEGVALPEAPDPSVRLRRMDAEGGPPAGTALVKLTSGSTLDPRGACFTEAALVEGIRQIVEGMGIEAADRVLIAIPLSHSYGFDNGVLSLAVRGTPLVLQQDGMPAALLRAIRERSVTFFPAVPALVRALGRVAWPQPTSLRAVICASAPLSREAAEEFRRASGIPVRQFYGATECGGISYESRPEDSGAEGTVGFPLPGVRLELAEGERVRVHSKANRFALLPEEPVPSFVETGDRAALTPEGRLRLQGRATLVANIGGLKVDLGALDAFFRSLPGVDEAATLPVEDPVRGHRIVAFVESRAQTPGALIQICRQRLSAREVPSEIQVLPSLPRTARGKLDREALRGVAR